MQKILLLLLSINLLFGASKDISDGKQRWDLTFNNNEANVYQKIWNEVDKVAVELDKINALVPRKTELSFCDEKGCGLDAVHCNVVTQDVVCPSGGMLDNALDLCILPPNVNCPLGYEANNDYSLCTAMPPCPSGTTYDSVSNQCVGQKTSTTSVSTSYSCPPSLYDQGSVCCEDNYTPASQTNSCPSGGSLSTAPSSIYQCSGKTFDSRARYITGIYLQHLCRCPDTAGFNYWYNSSYTNSQVYSSIRSIEVNTKHHTWFSSCAGKTICKKNCWQQASCPNGGYLSGSTCIKTCSTSIQCKDYCVWWSSKDVYGGKSRHSIYGGADCGSTHYDYWGTAPNGYNYEGSCGINNYTVSGTSSCNYAATPGYYYECSYDASTTYICNQGTLTGNQCETTDCMPKTEQDSCPQGENVLVCQGNFPDSVVKSLFINHLCRCPSQTEYNNWKNKFDTEGSYTTTFNEFKTFYNGSWSNSCSTIDVTVVGTNPVCQGNFSDTQILNLYTDHLCRCPEQAGYDYWLNLKNSGKSNSWIENAIKTSAQDNGEVWKNNCSVLDNSECYTTSPITEDVTCPTDNDYVLNNTISFNENTDQCESDIDISCDQNGIYTYDTPVENTCSLTPPCPTGQIYSSEENQCIVSVTCPLPNVSDDQCSGPLDDSWCSPWKCNDVNRCGFAYCENGTTPTGGTDYMPAQYFDYYQYKVAGICSSSECDLTLNKDITYCLDVTCPEGFEVYESGGSCYKKECPSGSTIDENGNCFVQECPEGTVEQADGSCLEE